VICRSPSFLSLFVSLGAVIVSACGPNAATATFGAASTLSAQATVTPVPWTTPTPDTAPRLQTPTAAAVVPLPGPTPPAVPTAVPPQFRAPTAAPAPSRSGQPLQTVPPTQDVPHPALPTPTPEPPVQCQFKTGTVSVPTHSEPTSNTPTPLQSTSGLSTVAAGEPMPGVFLEMRMSTPNVVAGTMVAPELVVRNTSNDEVSLSNFVSIAPDAQEQRGSGGQSDPREFPRFPQLGPQGAYDTRVLAGQTRAVVASAQAPFDASRSVHLHALAALGSGTSHGIPTRSVSLEADIPLRVVPATPADQLTLELKADRQQWCLRATDASGGHPTGPLVVGLTASDNGSTMMGSGIPGGTGDAWAQRWSGTGSPSMVQSATPVTLTLWVGGPHYVTAQAKTTISTGP
jgi:hypothetical protein